MKTYSGFFQMGGQMVAGLFAGGRKELRAAVPPLVAKGVRHWTPVADQARIAIAIAQPGTLFFTARANGEWRPVTPEMWIMRVELTSRDWDCECEKKYIHPRAQAICEVCGTYAEDGPDSRVSEVVASGFLLSAPARPEWEVNDAGVKSTTLSWKCHTPNLLRRCQKTTCPF